MSARLFSGHTLRLTRDIRQVVRSILEGNGTVPAFAQTLVTQVIVLGLNVVTGVLTARMLGPEGRGVFTAITLWPQFMATLVLLGLQNALVFYMRQSALLVNSILTAALLLGVLLSIVGGILGALCIPLAMGSMYPPNVIAFAVIATVAITGVNLFTMLLRPAFIVYGRIGTANNSAWANPLLYLAILVLAWRVLSMTAELAAACQFVAALVVLLWMASSLSRLYQPDLSGLRARVAALSSYTFRASAGEALAVLAANLDRLVLVPLIPPADLGLYAVAFSLSRLMLVLQAALVPVALPAMAGRSALEAKKLYDRLFRFTLYAVIVMSVAAQLCGGWALSLFYGPAFDAAVILFKILVLEAALSCLSFLPSQLYMTLARPGFLSIVQTASFLVTLVALLVLVPAYGAFGAAMGMLLSAVFRLCSLLAGLRLVLGFSPPRLIPEAGDLTRLLQGLRKQ